MPEHIILIDDYSDEYVIPEQHNPNPYSVLDVEEVAVPYKPEDSPSTIVSLKKKKSARKSSKKKVTQEEKKEERPNTKVGFLAELMDERYVVRKYIGHSTHVQTFDEIIDFIFTRAIFEYGPFIDTFRGTYYSMLSTFRDYDPDTFLPLIYYTNLTRYEEDTERTLYLRNKYAKQVKNLMLSIQKYYERQDRADMNINQFISIPFLLAHIVRSPNDTTRNYYIQMKQLLFNRYKYLLKHMNDLVNQINPNMTLGRNDLDDVLMRVIDFFCNKHGLGEYERKLLFQCITPSIYIQDIEWAQVNAPDLE